jgi:hypothetical protein
MLSMLFLLTTAAGSALWVAEIEQKKYVQQTTAHVGEYQDEP